jgi:hypothetical protein
MDMPGTPRQPNAIVQMVAHHPAVCAYLLAAVTLLVLVLAFMLVKCKKAGGKSGFEGYASGPMGAMPAPAGACPPGRHAITYQDPQGALMVRCGQNNVGPDMTACRGTWDPAATAEAQALATVGSLQHDSYGERSLMGAVDLAFDATTAAGLSDAQLQNLMHQGGTP